MRLPVCSPQRPFSRGCLLHGCPSQCLSAQTRCHLLTNSNFFFFLIFIYLFLDRGGEREKKRVRNINVWLCLTPPTGDPVCNPGMCPDWESTGDLLVRRPVLNPLSHTSQGNSNLFLKPPSCFSKQNCDSYNFSAQNVYFNKVFMIKQW